MDAADRILRANGNPELVDRILQDECRRKASRKLATTLSCPGFRFPTMLSAEQCTSDAVAEYHAGLIEPGQTVVDLTCGLGIDAFHCARRASTVLAIDIDPLVTDAVEPNARELGIANVHAICADCCEWLKETPALKFDVAFIDPARRGANGQRLFSLHDCQPDVTKLMPDIERIASKVIIKMSPMLDVKKVISELPHVTTLHIIGTASECKELVAEIDFEGHGPTRIVAATLGGHNLEFTEGDEEPETYAGTVAPGLTIGEPWPAVVKAAPKGLLNGDKLHVNSHLWLNPGEDFPGKIYRVERVETFSSSTCRKLAKEGLAASVATRNFPLSADALRSKLKCTESDKLRIVGTTLSDGKRVLIFMS